MPTDPRSEYTIRDSIMKLLSDNEVGSVSTAESAPRLTEGDEYLDLEGLHHGVRRAHGTQTPMGRVLPRKAVKESTWSAILKVLAASHPGAARATT